MTCRFLNLGRRFAVLPSSIFLPFLQILRRLQICFHSCRLFYGYVLLAKFGYDLIIPSLKAPKILPKNLDKISSGKFSKVALEILYIQIYKDICAARHQPDSSCLIFQPYITAILMLLLINASCSSLSNIRLISLPSTQLPFRQGRQITLPSLPALR
ncbi:hypothetical protein CAMSH0001_0565 [Campylobacter showae RM3277]|uniref:Uncharacterized protein n=1 Tax=Campylobacter showae RM3277 TaxID=553219 RepID=C6RGB2_9BACT|nr:hypothetical protein CAMSH0001_0565 [Campylobacter showae RM3277]